MRIKFSALLTLFLLCPWWAQAQRKPGDFVTDGPKTGKRIALTFDDGPGPNTSKFLDLLDRYHVKATFFMLGDQVKHRPAVAKDVVARGHEIGSHTMTHINYAKRYHYRRSQVSGPDADAKAVALTKADLLADMRQSREVIETVTGRKLKLLRMPNGIDRPWIKEAARESGFILVNWTFGGDWTSTPTDQLAKSYVHALRPGTIYLIHDGWPKSDKSLAMAEAVLEAARQQGYQVVPVGELIGLSNPQ